MLLWCVQDTVRIAFILRKTLGGGASGFAGVMFADTVRLMTSKLNVVERLAGVISSVCLLLWADLSEETS